jgi:hypothetical protein
VGNCVYRRRRFRRNLVEVTGREFAKLAHRHLMPHLPDLVLKEGTIYVPPVHRLARHISLYASGFGRARFTISCSVSILYVPDSYGAVLPGLGDRLPVLAGRGDRWWEWDPGDEAAEAAMMADIRTLVLDVGVPFLDELRTVEAVAERLRQTGEHLTEPHVAEALAYSLLLMGNDTAAKEVLGLLRRITLEDTERAEWWSEVGDPGEDDWVIEVGKRGARVEEALAVSPEGAIDLLDEWNNEQLQELRLPNAATGQPTRVRP